MQRIEMRANFDWDENPESRFWLGDHRIDTRLFHLIYLKEFRRKSPDDHASTLIQDWVIHQDKEITDTILL